MKPIAPSTKINAVSIADSIWSAEICTSTRQQLSHRHLSSVDSMESQIDIEQFGKTN
jgi:hypothetical protein